MHVMPALEVIVLAPALIQVYISIFSSTEPFTNRPCTDRPLIHINKKGRPVSQCPHCRGLRKARAQHVKCDCAEKPHTKEECPHDKTEVKKGITSERLMQAILIEL